MLAFSSHECEKPGLLPCVAVLEGVDVEARRIRGIRVGVDKIRVDIFPVKDTERSTREVLFSDCLDHGIAGFEGSSSKRFPFGDKDIYAFLRVPVEKRK